MRDIWNKSLCEVESNEREKKSNLHSWWHLNLVKESHEPSINPSWLLQGSLRGNPKQTKLRLLQEKKADGSVAETVATTQDESNT